MRTASVFVTYGLAVSTFVASWDHLEEPEFIRAVGGHSVALIAFVEPSSAASQALESEWIAISKSEKALASIDCSAIPQLCHDFDIISYPTIRYFDGHGNATPYRGPRTAAAIVSFLRRASRPAVTNLDEKKITAFQSIDDAVVVMRLNQHDTHLQTLYKSLAHRYKDRASFGLLDTEDRSSIECYNNKDDAQSSTVDLMAIEALSTFIDSCIQPLVGEFSRSNEHKYMQSGKSIVYYLAQTHKEREDYVDLIRPVAKKYHEFILFVTVDAKEYGSMTSALGLRTDSFPSLAVENLSRGQIFPFTEDVISPEAVDQFILDIAGGKVQPWSMLPVPEPVEHSHDEL